MKDSDRHYFYHASPRMEPVQRFLIAMTWYTLYRNRNFGWTAFVLYAGPAKDPVLKDVSYQAVFDFLADAILDERTAQGMRDAQFMGQVLQAEVRKRMATGKVPTPGIVMEGKSEQVSDSVGTSGTLRTEPVAFSESGGEGRQDARTDEKQGQTIS